MALQVFSLLPHRATRDSIGTDRTIADRYDDLRLPFGRDDLA